MLTPGAAVARGCPLTVHATVVERSQQPRTTTLLGTYATTVRRPASDEPSSSANSPPREAPRMPTRPASTDGCAASHWSALPKYSSGIRDSTGGRPSARKYASESTEYPCEARPPGAPAGPGRPPSDPPTT